MLTTRTARQWLHRWDRQQEYYLADREERFAVIADVVEAVTAGADPLIVDLGCGPGSLSARLLDRLPAARIVGIDADPLLLGLAEAAYGGCDGLRFVKGDLRASDWTERLELDRPPDVLVSTTALHWMNRDQFAALAVDCGHLVRPGGVFVNGDHMNDGADSPRLDRLTRAVRAGQQRRARPSDRETGRGQANGSDQANGGDGDDFGHRDEDWDAWWTAVEAAPELAALVDARTTTDVEHAKSDNPTYREHVDLLRRAGFTEVGTVWQNGDDRVLVAVAGTSRGRVDT